MPSAITRNSSGWSNAADDRVEIAGSDPLWREQFEAEAAIVRSVVTWVDGMRLEHFGSTAVRNLRAKPIIDILVIHPYPEAWPALIEPLSTIGYVYWAENPRRDRMLFVKGMPPFGSRRTHHIHVRVPGDFERELRFRDLLRTNTALAREYERLKERLAERYPANRDAYTEGKTEFVSRALECVPDKSQ